MDFIKEILTAAFEKQAGHMLSSDYAQNISETIKEIAETECFKALQKIKAVVEDDSLSDVECFYRIEEIVRIFEEMGSSAGNRHDF